ncbi:hypothetical protein HMPREF1547_01460 [Blautia sp. KLE 1732]|nr:hypothetical protein HMPREF1547_01460 [Blautia sp. KLE 1732]
MISTFVLFERCRFITYRFDCLKAEKEVFWMQIDETYVMGMTRYV